MANKNLKELFKSKRFEIQLGAVADTAQVDYKYQINLISAVPVAVIIAVSIMAVLLSGIWLSVLAEVAQSWGKIDNLFSLTTALFTTFWLIGWSVGTFTALAAFIIILTGRQIVLVHSGRMESIVGIIGIGLKINLRANEVQSCRLTDAGSATGSKSGGSKSGRQIQIETDNGEKNSPFGRHMTEQDLTRFQNAIDRNKNRESGLGDLPTSSHHGVDDEQADKPEYRLNNHLKSQQNATTNESESDTALTLTSPSTLLLILANLVPLVGVVLFDWDLGSTMVLYWTETAIILFYTVCKGFVRYRWLGLFVALFMVAHAGAFMSIHLLFIWSIFVEGLDSNTQFSNGNLHQVANYFINLWPALFALFISHGFSFKVNFLDKRGTLKINIQKVSKAEAGKKKAGKEDTNHFYSRIISMHVTIIFGGGAAMILGSGVFALIMLIVLKIMADVRAHLKQYAAS